MATKAQCEAAFAELARKLSDVDPNTRKKVVLDRSVAAKLTDLQIAFQGNLRDGGLHDIREIDHPDAQITLTMSSDTLVALTDGSLGFGSAFATGKLKIDASIMDLLKLKSIF